MDKPLQKGAVLKRGLGRGLGALLPEAGGKGGAGGLRQCRLELITPDAKQPRRNFKDESLEELTASIREHGVLQPLIVRPAPEDGSFILVAGERRWRAAGRAGLTEVPVLVMPLDDSRGLQVSLIENLQREDLNPLEEARGYQRLLNEFSLSQVDVARLLGKNRATVSNMLRLLKLPEAAQQCLIDESLSMGHGRALLALAEGPLQERALRETLAGRLSVRELERLVKKLNREAQVGDQEKAPVTTAAGSREEDSGIARRLAASFAAPAKLRRLAGGRGRLEFTFKSEEELKLLLARLLGPEEEK